jgi:multidrug efflux pump subunit AcrB
LAQIRSALPEIERTLSERVSLWLTAGAEPTSHGGLLVEMLAPPRTNLEMLRKLADHLERPIRSLTAPGVLSVWTRDNDTALRFLFRAKEKGTDEDALLVALRRHCNELPGVQSRVAELPRGAAAWQPRYDVDLALMGPNRDQLKKWSSAVACRLADAGYQDVVNEASAPTPEISLKPRRDRLAQLGLDLQSVERAMQAGTDGVLLSGGGSESPAIRAFLEDEFDERKPWSLHVPVGDSLVPVSALVDAELVAGLDRLQRRNMRPMVRVTAALPAGGDSTQSDVALRLAEEIGRELELSDEYCVEHR